MMVSSTKIILLIHETLQEKYYLEGSALRYVSRQAHSESGNSELATKYWD
jgi:hypothetical protein